MITKITNLQKMEPDPDPPMFPKVWGSEEKRVAPKKKCWRKKKTRETTPNESDQTQSDCLGGWVNKNLPGI